MSCEPLSTSASLLLVGVTVLFIMIAWWVSARKDFSDSELPVLRLTVDQEIDRELKNLEKTLDFAESLPRRGYLLHGNQLWAVSYIPLESRMPYETWCRNFTVRTGQTLKDFCLQAQIADLPSEEGKRFWLYPWVLDMDDSRRTLYAIHGLEKD